MTRAAVYLRQSKDRNGDELAITRQRADCLKLCREKGWEPTEYPDNDVSASSGKRRPHYERMLTDIEAGKLDAVVVWDLDRLHRRPIELEEFIDLADRHKLALATVTGECDLGTHNGRLYARIKGAVARAEMDQKSCPAEAGSGAARGERHPMVERAPVRVPLHRGRPGRSASGPVPTDPGRRRQADPGRHRGRRDPTGVPLRAGGRFLLLRDDRLERPGRAHAEGQPLARKPGAAAAGVPAQRRSAHLPRKITGPGNWHEIVPESTWRGVADKLADPKRHYGPSRARKHLLLESGQVRGRGLRGADG